MMKWINKKEKITELQYNGHYKLQLQKLTKQRKKNQWYRDGARPVLGMAARQWYRDGRPASSGDGRPPVLRDGRPSRSATASSRRRSPKEENHKQLRLDIG
jgi:hypothetical protein